MLKLKIGLIPTTDFMKKSLIDNNKNYLDQDSEEYTLHELKS